MVTNSCQRCGVAYPVSAFFQARSRYCSTTCQHLGARKRAICTCKQCGATYEVIQSKVGKTSYCSRSCKYQARSVGTPLRTMEPCTQCGKPCKRLPHMTAVKRFCSRTCWRLHNRGPDHSTWKGGTGWYKTQRKVACERCGATKKLIVHHRDENRANNSLENLETLCRSCHQRHHNAGQYVRREPPKFAGRAYRELLKAAPGHATPAQIAARRAYYGGLCWVCRKASGREIDHVIPISQGGSKWPANLRPICRRCNASRGSAMP